GDTYATSGRRPSPAVRRSNDSAPSEPPPWPFPLPFPALGRATTGAVEVAPNGPPAAYDGPPPPGPTGTGCRRRGPPRSPAPTSRANASGPRATASSQGTTTSASSETSSPRWSTRPATSRIAPSCQVGP